MDNEKKEQMDALKGQTVVVKMRSCAADLYCRGMLKGGAAGLAYRVEGNNAGAFFYLRDIVDIRDATEASVTVITIKGE